MQIALTFLVTFLVEDGSGIRSVGLVLLLGEIDALLLLFRRISYPRVRSVVIRDGGTLGGRRSGGQRLFVLFRGHGMNRIPNPFYKAHAGRFPAPRGCTFRSIHKERPPCSHGFRICSNLPPRASMKSKPQVLSYTVLLAAIIYLCVKPGQGSHHPLSEAAAIARGEYLVRLGGCSDCHTPKIMTERGPKDDPARLFAGHPADVVVPPPGPDSGPWGAATAGMTAWSGPWGVSYAANLTPDPSTGLWTRDSFVKAMRTGKHRGWGREILPPMPWESLSKATDEDLDAIYAYLHSLPPVFNPVPDPTFPTAATAGR